MSPRRWKDLDGRERRRLTARTFIVIAVAWTVLIGVYYLLPLDGGSGWEVTIRLVSGIVLFGVVLVWQLRHISTADVPELRAVRALGVIIPLFLVVFASTYLSLSHSSASHFSESLNHTAALYLTVTVFATVGFGDIVPKGDLARTFVTIQMILDLIVIGAVARLLINAARTGLDSEQGPERPPRDLPP